jgi:NDP-sugar pyrophosphorylase family protein
MLPALGKPFVVRIMDRLRRIGVNQFVVVVGVDEGALASFLNTQWYPDVKVEFKLRAGGESLATILSEIVQEYPEPFIVTTYTSFAQANFPERLLNTFEKDGLDDLLLSVAPTTLSNVNPDAFEYALVEGERVVTIVRERPRGVPVMFLGEMAVGGPGFIEYLAKSSYLPFTNQLTDVFRGYMTYGGAAYAAEAAWLLPVKADIDLLTLNRHLLDEDQDAHILSEIHPSVRIVPPVRVDPSVSIGQGAKIGPHVYLESNSSVGQGASLSNTMVLQNVVIPAGAVVQDVIVSSRAHIRL